jgi:hypothetical protein
MQVDYTEVDREVLRGYHDPLPSQLEGVRLASIEEQADLAEQVGTQTLYRCLDPWALRHSFASHETGEMIPARCDRWTCEYCGPRKTDQWRQLIAAAEPTLFVTLTRAGNTLEEASRALTTWIQAIRRGSKGKGKEHVGARPAYPVKYFVVNERHSNFEEVGFHWHLLLKGVDYLPFEHIRDCWLSATHGHSYIVNVQRITKKGAIGYVTKYLTKEISHTERGGKEEQREALALGLDEQGNRVLQKQTYTVKVESHARRIRYSRDFFPMSTEELRFRLFSKVDDPEHPEQLVREGDASCGEPCGDGMQGREIEGEQNEESQANDSPATPQRPRWSLIEVEPYTSDYQEYLFRRRRATLEALKKVRAGEWRISGRVLSVWSFQRSQKRRQDVRLAG